MTYSKFVIRTFNILLLLGIILSCFMQSCAIQEGKNVEDKKGDTILVLNMHKVHMCNITEAEYKKIAKAEQINFDTITVAKIDEELILKLANNKKFILKDSLVNSDNVEQVTYTYVGYLSDVDFYVIKAQHYETGEYLLINARTGDKVKIWGKPKLSPDKKHIVTSSNALEYDAMPNGIQMWALQNGALKLEWEYKQNEWEAEDIVWANNNTLYFIKRIPDFISKTTKEGKYFTALTI